MSTINFTYNYPYCGYSETAKYGCKWSESRYTLNGCYTYPVLFNNSVDCKSIHITFEVENTGSGTVIGRSWQFKVYRKNYGWVNIEAFTLAADGKYSYDGNIGYVITMAVIVPSSNPGSSRSWTTSFDVERLTIIESVTTEGLTTGKFQYGVFPNRYGLSRELTEVYAQINGALVPATDVLVNIDGTLSSLPPVYSGYFISTVESMRVFEFTVPSDGTYRIKNKSLSGDHEIRLYDSEFNQLSSNYFYSQSFALTGGALLYISVTHYYNDENAGESYLQIFKED